MRWAGHIERPGDMKNI